MRSFRGICMLVLSICFKLSLAQDYDSNDIPDALLTNANAVIREQYIQLRILNKSRALQTTRIVTTVLNENGKYAAFLVLPYNKYLKYKDIKGTIYDKTGQKIRNIKNNEILDFSDVSSYSLYEDSRKKIIRPEYKEYPYTIEYSYELIMDGFFQFSPWVLLPGYNISAQKSQYRAVFPENMNLYHKEINFHNSPSIDAHHGNKIISWDMENLEAVKKEPFSRSLGDLLPIMYVCPAEFKYGGVKGDMSSWQSFGRWLWKLIENKDQFNKETQVEILSLVNNCKSDHEKVEVLYKYMQNRVRYVNISIGLGGLEPIEAQRVHDVGYGDCKALSNYMRSLLKVAGIESIYSAVYSGSHPNEVITDFPSSQFNHVILMVPMEKDSIWLECTSLRLPPGYLGEFTDNRTVLFVTPEGGKLGKTPSFSLEDNHVSCRTNIKLDENLNAQIKKEKHSGGIFFNREYSTYLERDETEQKRSIINNLRLSEFRLESLSYNVNTTGKPLISEIIEISDDKMLIQTGEFIMLALNILSDEILIPERVRNRIFPLFQFRDQLKTDSIFIELPETIITEEIPEPILIHSEFGKYYSKVELIENKILYIQRIEYYKGEFPPKKYTDFYNFMKSVNKAAKITLVLKHKSQIAILPGLKSKTQPIFPPKLSQ